MIFYKTMKKFFSNLFSTWEKCVSLNCGNFYRTTYMPFWTFLSKIRCRKTYLKLFLGLCVFLAAFSPKGECIFPLMYNVIFKPCHLSRPLAPLCGEIHTYPRELFCLKFDVEKLLFEVFLGVMHIFSSVQSKSESLLFFILSRSNRILVLSYFQYSPVSGTLSVTYANYLSNVQCCQLMGVRQLARFWC